jgi:hypothetical protein
MGLVQFFLIIFITWLGDLSAPSLLLLSLFVFLATAFILSLFTTHYAILTATSSRLYGFDLLIDIIGSNG